MTGRLPDFDRLWDFQDPEGTEARFRELLPQACGPEDQEYRAELLTQIARTLGLRQQFDEAHAILDEADALIAPGMLRARVRSLLERGRTINSSGAPERSVAHFEQALEEARDAGLDLYAVDAAHMLGIVCEGDESIAWNERALELAEASEDEHTRGWRAPLYNNLGWTYHGLDRHRDALRMFEKHLEVRTGQGNEFQIGIARWSIAKMHRFLGDVEQALAMQEEQLERPERQDNPAEGYTREEIGECLLLLGREAEAAPHFARAWELLHTDRWLQRDEAERLERMKRLGGVG